MKNFNTCNHSMDLSNSEPADWEDLARFREAGFWVRCKHCNCRILIVDDTGNFVEDPNTGQLEEYWGD